jgi:hypothetical protein
LHFSFFSASPPPPCSFIFPVLFSPPPPISVRWYCLIYQYACFVFFVFNYYIWPICHNFTVCVYPLIIIIIIIIYYYYTLRYNISALRNFTLAMSDDFLYVTYSMEFHLGSQDSRVILTTLPPYSPDDRGTTVSSFLSSQRIAVVICAWCKSVLQGSTNLSKTWRYLKILVPYWILTNIRHAVQI